VNRSRRLSQTKEACSRLWAGGKSEPSLEGTANWSMVENLSRSSVGEGTSSFRRTDTVLLTLERETFLQPCLGEEVSWLYVPANCVTPYFGLVWPVGNTPCVVLLLVQPEEGCQRHDAGLAAQKSHIMHASKRLGLGVLGLPGTLPGWT
jgi:hypothetical protein